jgi:putative ABC transport system permease protein
MTLTRLLWRNLLYHWRGNLAVLLGVAVGAAVLTGALLVGDSLRGSLRALALDQLGWVDEALVTPRFFRAELAKELPAEHIAPAILLQGSASLAGSESRPIRRAGKVTILGVDARFWGHEDPPAGRTLWPSEDNGVVLNASLAEALAANTGDTVTLHVQKADSIPRETLLGKRKSQETTKPLTLTVRAIVPDRGVGRFTLKPSPEPPRNAFVPLGYLQRELVLGGRANALLATRPTESLPDALRRHLTLSDWGIKLVTPNDRAAALVRLLTPPDRPVDGILRFGNYSGRVPEELAKRAGKDRQLTQEQIAQFYREKHGYLSLESQQLFIEPAVERAALALTRKHPELRAAPTLVYLADTITDGTGEIPYAVVAATDAQAPPPLGPLLDPETKPLSPGEIILADRAANDGPRLSPLTVEAGGEVTLLYYVPDAQGQLQKKSAVFSVREVIALRGPADDPFLTPEFPGITDRRDIGDITQADLPFPYDPKRTRKPHVNEAWKRYRTSPRAYVSLAVGQELWQSDLDSTRAARRRPDSGRATDPRRFAGRFEARAGRVRL